MKLTMIQRVDDVQFVVGADIKVELGFMKL